MYQEPKGFVKSQKDVIHMFLPSVRGQYANNAENNIRYSALFLRNAHTVQFSIKKHLIQSDN